MKVTFQQKKLMAVLVAAANIPQVKNAYLPCTGLLFECPPNKRFVEYPSDTPNLCRISGFDLDKGIQSIIECTVHEKGMCIIPAQTIVQIVRSLPDDEITLETFPNNSAVISAGKINFRTSVSPGENFPALPMISGSRTYRIPQHLLRRLLSETVFAVAQTDVLRMGFHGGLFRIHNGRLTIAGCDNNKLALSCGDISVDPESAEEIRFILPGKFLSELQHLLNDTEAEVTITAGRKHVMFKFNNFCFFTRMLEIEYPDYKKMLPVSYSTQIYLSRTELLEAIERASIIAEAKLGGIGGTYIKLEFTNNTVLISSVSSGGAIEETLSIEMSGTDLTIGFECRNLLETLKAIPKECDRLRLRMNTPVMGITIESEEGSLFTDPAEKEKTLLPAGMNRFMYFVLPTRMNIPAK